MNCKHKYSQTVHIAKVTANMNTLPRLFIIYPKVVVEKILRSLNVLNLHVHASVAHKTAMKEVAKRTERGFGAQQGHVHVNLKH